MMCNNAKLDLINMNAYIKFGENMVHIIVIKSLVKICPFVLKILSGNEILE